MRRKRRFLKVTKINFKVSTSEAWFPELERVLNSAKDEYFFPRERWSLWGPTAALG